MNKIVLVCLAVLALAASGYTAEIKEYPGFVYLGSRTSSDGIGVLNTGIYYYHKAMADWNSAQSSCEGLGPMTNLVTLETYEEQKDLLRYMRQGDIAETWTSGLAHNGVWKWSSGAGIPYMNRINWINGPPPTTTGSYIYIKRGATILDDGWDAAPQSTPKPYICEESAD